MIAIIALLPLAIAYRMLHLWGVDLSLPLIYTNADDIWQFVLTKMLKDTGWILFNPYLGAPEIASWHHNAAAQTSAAHSLIMKVIGWCISDPVKIQQIYYLANFPLITGTSYLACRMLRVGRLPALCVGLLFAFTSFRINELIYAFLANYFAIPLALVPIFWILKGDYAANTDDCRPVWRRILAQLNTKKFAFGMLFIVLVTLSDGYYAFFTLLLLGFSLGMRLLMGDWRSVPSMTAPIAFIVGILATSAVLMVPLEMYKQSHIGEFYPNGQIDTSLSKQSFEAEVYSTSLKMMIAPIAQHRISQVGDFGKNVVKTSDDAKLFKNGRALVPLGTICTALLALAFIRLLMPSFKRWSNGSNEPAPEAQRIQQVAQSLVLFIFLCSIAGGIGTLVALIFPTIRAYDRFPLFIIFVLLVSAASFITGLLERASSQKRVLIGTALIALTGLGLLDQIPKVQNERRDKSAVVYAAEQKFVRAVESQLPIGAMVYQYPYSQYLRQNKYYGWGSFSHVRLYLHSRSLHWSNGGAKNSPADDWNFRISELPLDDLFTEVRAVGFRAVVVDRSVLDDDEYNRVKAAIAKISAAPVQEDIASKLAFATLPDPGYVVKFNSNYVDADAISISSVDKTLAAGMSRFIDRSELLKKLREVDSGLPLVVSRIETPGVFISGRNFTRGIGETPIQPFDDLKGSLSCTKRDDDVAVVTIKNDSDFLWQFNRGTYPLGLGIHFYQADGKLLQHDSGVRWKGELSIPPNSEQSIILHTNDWEAKAPRGNDRLTREIQMLQEGSTWFAKLTCQI